jgi:hypothetical protein
MNKPLREGFVTEDTKVELLPGGEVSPVPPAEEPKADVWPVTIKLVYKPIMGPAGQPVKELSFRQPTGGDINRYGMPVRFGADGAATIEERKMTMMMASLAGVLYPAMEQMDARDWMACAMRVQGFFIPDLERAWS